jgi:hypothetical protein
MTKGKKFAVKHGKNVIINPALAAKIKEKAIDGRLACAVAFKISEDMDVKPADVGISLDLLEVKIAKCQLGIFGFEKGNKIVKPVEQVSDPFEKAIREGLIDGKLPCIRAWQIAEMLGAGKMDVASACDSLGIKISPCQLGAF